MPEERPTVVELKREGWRSAPAALRAIADQIEAGELPSCEVGALVMKGGGGDVEVFGFGPRAEDLQVIATLRLGEEIVVRKALRR